MARSYSAVAVSALAGAAAAALLFSFLSFMLPLADSVGHFRIHLTAATAVAAGLLLLLDQRRAAGALCAVSFLGAIGLAPAFPVWNATKAVDGMPSIKLVQLNLSFRNRNLDAVADLMRRERADIITLQEVTRRTGRIMTLLEGEYPHSVVCRFATVGGVAVLSRLPAAPGPSQGCMEKAGLAWLRIMAGGHPVSVASVHLHWPYPFGQPRQLDRLQPSLQAIPRPVLVAGDFNAAPWSHAVARVAAATNTAVAGGLRFTYDLRPIRWVPALAMPIDHVLLPSGFTPLELRSAPGPGSDHAAIVAHLALGPDPQ